MPSYSNEDIEASRKFVEQQEELKKRQAAEAAQAASVESTDDMSNTPAGDNSPSPEEVALGQRNESGAYEQTENTAEKQTRSDGLVTQIGEGLSYLAKDATGDVLDGALGFLADNLPEGTPAIKEISDFILSSGEIDQLQEDKAKQDAERRAAGEMNPAEQVLDTTLNAITGLSAGVEGGIALPATIAARISNQASPWADPPAVLKESPIGETIFEIAQIAVPTLLTAGVAGPALGGTAGLLTESAIETATQDSFEDLIAGRSLAGKFGEVADYLGMDGANLTKDLIEGKTFESQAFTAVVGFIQNLGINFGANKLFEKITGSLPNPTKSDNTVAKVLGKNVEDVQRAVADVSEPNYSRNLEPSDVTSIDDAVPVVKPAEGEIISQPGLISEAIRKAGIGEDGLTDAGRQYFTNWKTILSTDSMAATMQAATNTLKKLKDYPSDMKRATDRGLGMFRLIKQSLDIDDFDGAASTFRKNSSIALDATVKADDIPDSVFLREMAQVDQDGFVTAGLIGEELGVRLKKAAMQADALEGIGVDFTNAVENLLELQDKASLFMIPLRRAKRRWAVEGSLQQRNQLKKLKDADITDAQAINAIPFNAPAKELEYIKGLEETNLEKNNTIRQLWDLYKTGDVEAGQTLKAYVNIVAHGDPRTVLTNVVDLTKTLADNVKRGNKDAITALIYNSRLSRFGTQVSANLNTLLLTVGDPIGNMLSGVGPGLRGDWSESAYGLGTFLGGLEGASDSLRAFGRSFKNNDTFVKPGGARFDANVKNLKQKQAILQENYDGARRRLNDEKAPTSEKFSLFLSYANQTMANNPYLGYGPRLLMAADEGITVIRGSQIARGRAFQEAVQTGTFGNSKELKRLVDVHTKKIFSEAKRSGKIIDGEVLQSARKLTFTSQIGEIGSELEIKGFLQAIGNGVDSAFMALESGAKESAWWNLVSPFTRVSYEALEAVARYDPTPGSLLRRMHPRYKAIMDGKYGETARLQLKSNIAQGQLFTIATIGAAYTGLTTGENSGSMPKRSFIIPANNEEGYIAISYAKLEPFATIIATVTDITQGLRDEVVDQGRYDLFLSTVTATLATSLIQKSFQDGMRKAVELLNVTTIVAGTHHSALAGFAGNFVPRIFDMIGDFANPYVGIAGDNDDGLASFFQVFAKRNLGDFKLPPDYNIYSGKKVAKAATLGDSDNYWNAVGGAIISELGWTGNVVNVDQDNPSLKMMNKILYPPKKPKYFKQAGGVNLNPQEQSDLKRGMFSSGKINERLKAYFNSKEFKQDMRDHENVRKHMASKGEFGYTGPGSTAGKYMKRIHGKIDQIHGQAKEATVRAVLYPQESFREKARRISIEKLSTY